MNQGRSKQSCSCPASWGIRQIRPLPKSGQNRSSQGACYGPVNACIITRYSIDDRSSGQFFSAIRQLYNGGALIIGTSMTGPATGYGASNPASYNELSKPSGQAHQLEGQLQLVQASKPSRNSTVSTCEQNHMNMTYNDVQALRLFF